MKRKALALTFILTFLFSTVAATECINFASANPRMYMYPYANQTLVSVYSPENHSIQNVKWLNVNFTVDLTEWKGGWGLPVFNPDYSFSSAVTCYLDSTPVWQKTLNSAQKHNFSFTLNDLSDGLHNIIVNSTTVGTHFETEPEWNLSHEPIFNSSGVVFFTVDAVPPNLSILGLENKTYYSSDIEIEYTVSEVSNVTCSLDGNENFSISQNTMFSNLTIGKHNATFFAVDRAGNTDSKTIYFTIAEPFPVIPVAAGSTISISALATGLLVFFKKRRR